MNIVIVGAGTSGLMTALILKRAFPLYNIKIIKSDKIGIIGVGEGSTEHVNEFINFVGIDEDDLFKYAGATFKSGIYFKNWLDKDYFHIVPGEMEGANFIQNKLKWYSLISRDLDFDFSYLKKGLLSSYTKPVQYHFDTFKLNEFLQKICLERNIKIEEDLIKDITLNDLGFIDKIKGKKEYTADLFVDCSGFNRLLISKYKVKFKSKDVFVNKAIAFQTEKTEDIPAYTLSQKMDFGWMWRIPTQGRWGNGYVYNEDFCPEAKAADEIQRKLNIQIKEAKIVEFDSGYLEKSWVKNCCAIGLTSSFFEPLEATSIASTINSAFMLLNCLPEQSRELFNKKIEAMYENLHAFVYLSYMNGDVTTKFWRHVTNSIKPSDYLSNIIEMSKYKLPNYEVLNSNYYIFQENNFISKLRSYGFIKPEAIKSYYNNFLDKDKQEVDSLVDNFINSVKDMPKLSHRDFINERRSNII